MIEIEYEVNGGVIYGQIVNQSSRNFCTFRASNGISILTCEYPDFIHSGRRLDTTELFTRGTNTARDDRKFYVPKHLILPLNEAIAEFNYKVGRTLHNDISF